jgi:uncharacterized protein YjbI with pentapeptide repeats
MALIKCNECGKEISSNAVNCPGCGNPLTQSSPATPVIEPGQFLPGSTVWERFWGKDMKFVAALLLVSLCIFIFAPSDEERAHKNKKNEKNEKVAVVNDNKKYEIKNSEHEQQLLSTKICKQCDLYRANLKGTNLEGANLEGAKLKYADLDGANLKGANLNGAYLYGANLERADLFKANLSEAKLFKANLDGANLSDANLNGAYLRGANLKG